MRVKIEIPYHLLQLVDNHETVEVEGVTVRECLLKLARKYPAMAPEVFDINGEMAVIVLHADVSINEETIDTPVKDGDTLAIYPIIIGG